MAEDNNGRGIYIILNILDCKVYVGQAKRFWKRTHLETLQRGKDNSNLQTDYNNGSEFVYLVVRNLYDDSEDLDKYERLYMTLLEDFGLTLYNHNISKKDRNSEKLGFNEAERLSEEDKIIKLFLKYFNIEPKDLVKFDSSQKICVWNCYKANRLKRVEGSDDCDILLFDRNTIRNIIGSKEIRLASINISEMFISRAGNYVGQGLDQILYCKVEDIKKYGYCLWAFANNHVCAETVRRLCEKRRNNNEDTYACFTFTNSTTYSFSYNVSYNCLTRKTCKSIENEFSNEKEFLRLQGIGSNLKLPDGINCTSSYRASVNAFVIQEIFPTDDVIDFDKLDEQYEAVNKYERPYAIINSKTCFIRRKDGEKTDECNSICAEESGRQVSFIAKLAAPYVIALNQE